MSETDQLPATRQATAIAAADPLRDAVALAAQYARDAHAPETLRAYRHDWAAFQSWCVLHDGQALDATGPVVAAWLASLAATHSRSALRRRLAAIGYHFRLHGRDWNSADPAIRTTLRGIGRTHGIAFQKRPAAALCSPEIKALLKTCDDDLAGTRDRALLLLGFTGALRRSELVGLDLDDVREVATGLRVRIRRSKADPEAEGVELAIPRGKHKQSCAVRALAAWIARADLLAGPIFRKVDQWGHVQRDRLGADAVRRILLRRAAAAGLAVSAAERLSPHGLRAGFITEAYRGGARDEQIMGHTRHKDLRSMRGYVRRARLDLDSPVALLDV